MKYLKIIFITAALLSINSSAFADTQTPIENKLTDQQMEAKMDQLANDIETKTEDFLQIQKERKDLEKEFHDASAEYLTSKRELAALKKEIGYDKVLNPDTLTAEEKKQLEAQESLVQDNKEELDGTKAELVDAKKSEEKLKTELDKLQALYDKLDSVEAQDPTAPSAAKPVAKESSDADDSLPAPAASAE